MDGIWDTVAGIAWSLSWQVSFILPFGLALAAWGAVAHRPENPYPQVIPVHKFWLLVPVLVGFSDLIVAMEEGIRRGRRVAGRWAAGVVIGPGVPHELVEVMYRAVPMMPMGSTLSHATRRRQ